MSPLDPQETATAVTAVNEVTEAGRMAPKDYDAVLLASFGGPEGQDDVIPFLRNVTRGRGIPDERLEEVSHHYRANGGISPINQQNRELKAGIEAELAARGDRAAGVLGQPQLGPVHPADPPGHLRRRAPQGPHGHHERLLLLLQLPPVPRGHRHRADRDRPGRKARSRQGPPVLRPPRLRRAVHRRHRRRPRRRPRPAGRGRHPGRARAHPVRHALHPHPRRRGGGPLRRRTAPLRGRLRLRRAAPGHRHRGHPPGGSRDRRHRPLVPRLPVPLRRPARAVAGTGHQRRHRGTRRPGRQGHRDRAARLRQRPHGSCLGPRHRGPGDLRQAGPGREPGPHARDAPQVRRRTSWT